MTGTVSTHTIGIDSPTDFPQLRDPNEVMTLERMGAFHQSRLSFLRVLLRRIRQQGWTFDRPVFDIASDGTGTATYSATGPERTYTLIVFSHDLPASKRSDRVIADAWDATFTLFDGIPEPADIDRLRQSVPKQEAGRLSHTEFTLSRANRSVRMFDYVLDTLASGQQPEASVIDSVGYLMRTTAVYGSGKFGAADRQLWANRPEFSGSFQPELLTVWLIRSFTLDLVEHLAHCRNPTKAVRINPDLRRRFGVGNSTGLGMAPFLINHPRLIHQWILAREQAILAVRKRPEASATEKEQFLALLRRSLVMAKHWNTEHLLQAPKVATLREELPGIITALDSTDEASILNTRYPWHRLLEWAEKQVSLEAQELLASLMLEPFPDLVDPLAESMSCDESLPAPINGKQSLQDLAHDIDTHYAWINAIDYEHPDATARVWYVSEEKLEPRLGDRHDPENPEPFEPYEQPLQPGRDVKRLRHFLQQQPEEKGTVAALLLDRPEFRQTVRRIQLTAKRQYAEIRDNTISHDMLPIDLLRCKLSFFGATHFDPRSDRWVRITLFQGAPFPEELASSDPDDAAYPPLEPIN